MSLTVNKRSGNIKSLHTRLISTAKQWFSAVAWQLWQAWLYIEQTKSPFVFQRLCLNFSWLNIQTSAYSKYIGAEVSLKGRGDLHLIKPICFDKESKG